MPINLGSPEHWRRRAAEARQQAEEIRDDESRRAMLAVAKSYEQIAKRAEELRQTKSN
jgi:hypothetical protein